MMEGLGVHGRAEKPSQAEAYATYFLVNVKTVFRDDDVVASLFSK